MKIDFIKNHKFLKTFFLLPAIFFLTCTSLKNQSDEIILAKIGDKQISVKQFLQRSELTIKANNFKSQNTTPNNLMAEKILALEAEHDDKLLLNPSFQGRLKGIKEQLMRDKLYTEVAFKKVELDSQEIKNAYRSNSYITPEKSSAIVPIISSKNYEWKKMNLTSNRSMCCGIGQ